MYEKIREAALKATLNIFETMFFTFLEPREVTGVPEGPEPDLEKVFDLPLDFKGSNFLQSEIFFEGFYSGSMRLFIPYDFGRELTMNFLGFEEEVTETQIEDMAGELTNMICGNLFAILDKTYVFDLSAPITQKIKFEERIKLAETENVILGFSTEGQPVSLALQFKKNEDNLRQFVPIDQGN